MPVVVAGFKSSGRRSDLVADAVAAALRAHTSQLNASPAVRSVTLSVKLRTDVPAVRAVVVVIETEHLAEGANP